jgi:hypothetical protein
MCNLSCPNSTRRHPVDEERQTTDLAVGGSNPSRRAAAALLQLPRVQAGKVLVARAGHPDGHAPGLGPSCRLWLHDGLATP